jgi:Ca2+-dependent lipid-binding protein
MDPSKGKFTLVVRQARLTRNTSAFGSMDPYVIVHHNATKFSTKVAKNAGKLPEWNERFEVTPENPDDILDIRVMDDCIGEDDPIGGCSIALTRLNK